MRILNLLAFATIGGVLASCDVTVSTWQFWAILIAACFIKITEHFTKYN